ncbi:hypothetical protein CHLRE_06g258250v5 [Chlamydomonas reinhardtii]|uniref:Glycosyltransferase family 92 protein n=1 Tax=Chlamydomonas reinhardtii TaxID=3055 RepID=A0A2K3DMH2_CHLRE|nr:uncharacterized protein CHLRE_06g258250v5 [Chlamydomonas reinhardtii]PNW81739.1 hypothetical protein CHLRE_06g258250v5 [Chlamydomonas reinhardtii]
MAAKSLLGSLFALLVAFFARALAWQSNLGVLHLPKLYARAPIAESGPPPLVATIELDVWARRVGGPQPAYALPHQGKPAIRLLVWIGYAPDPHIRSFGHLALPVDPRAWAPQLVLEPEGPSPVIQSVLESRLKLLEVIGGHQLRPYSLRFELPPGLASATCFRLLERSYPDHKQPFCLPVEGLGVGELPAFAALPRRFREWSGADAGDEVRTVSVCDQLAPPQRYTDGVPALWAVVGPPRHPHSDRDWGQHLQQIAIRTVHYLAYHVAMGMSGLLLYTDAVQRHYLRRVPALQPYLTAGHLRLVDWDLPERNHADDGRGRPLGYNYDQALVTSHALLGLSACGANLLVLTTDFDEYLYSPKPGVRWPDSWAACMPRQSPPPQQRPVAVWGLMRFELLSSAVAPRDEAALWSASPQPAGEEAGAAAVVAQSPLLAYYDRRGAEPINRVHAKHILMPGREVVSFFVHEGAPLHGARQFVEADCLQLLHVSNYWRPRSHGGNGSLQHLDAGEFVEFRHWMAAGAAAAAAETAAGGAATATSR